MTHDFIDTSKVFAISVLDETTPLTFIGLFGFRSGRDIDKLSRVRSKPGVTGCPLVTEHTISVLEARVVDRIDLGSHTIFIGEAVSSEVLCDGHPMTYQFYHLTLKGKTSANAPTFQPVR